MLAPTSIDEDESDETPIIEITTTTTGTMAVVPDCAFPEGATDYTLITKGDATIHAHSIGTGIAIGGTLYDGTSQANGVVTGKAIYGAKLGGSWSFNGGAEQGALPFDWTVFEWLAQNLVDYNSGGYKVKVFKQGGTYSMDSILHDSQGEDNGHSLMVFNTNADINLKQTSGGRQFGPSVLAPFSTVTLQGNAGYIDGFVIAEEFGPSGLAPKVSNPDALQMHGDYYTGPLTCK
jgi:hypothetical protein